MKIKVSGVQGAVARELEDAALFFGRILLHHRTVPNIILDIDVMNDMSDPGMCTNEDHGKKNPRYFTIAIRNREEDQDPVQVLAHEMVHLKQYATNQLSRESKVYRNFSVKSVPLWEGKEWKPNKGQDEYWDSPWEVEAYGREIGLYHRWVLLYNLLLDATEENTLIL